MYSMLAQASSLDGSLEAWTAVRCQIGIETAAAAGRRYNRTTDKRQEWDSNGQKEGKMHSDRVVGWEELVWISNAVSI